MAKGFARVDKNNDGALSAKEFAKLRHMGKKSVEVALSLKQIKTQGNSWGSCPQSEKLLMSLCTMDMPLDALTDASDDAILVLFSNGDQSAATALT